MLLNKVCNVANPNKHIYEKYYRDLKIIHNLATTHFLCNAICAQEGNSLNPDILIILSIGCSQYHNMIIKIFFLDRENIW